MDKRTRGFIETQLDQFILETNVTDGMRWILDELPITRSPEEIALGYVLGSLMRYYHDVVRIRKHMRQSMRLRNRIKKAKTADELKSISERKPKDLDVTQEDVVEIRDILRRRLQDIMAKINIELGK